MHVDGNGTVVVTYYDLRNNTTDPAALDTDYFAVSCESASESCTDPASWEEVRITPASFNIRNAPFARGYFLGDYMGLDNARRRRDRHVRSGVHPEQRQPVLQPADALAADIQGTKTGGIEEPGDRPDGAASSVTCPPAEPVAPCRRSSDTHRRCLGLRSGHTRRTRMR